MNTTSRPRTRNLVIGAGLVVALGIGTAAVVVAAGGDDLPDTPIPVEPDGGTGDTPIPVEPDGGIGDTPGDEFPVDAAREAARNLLGVSEADLEGVDGDVRIGRRGAEWMALTEDFVLGRMTVELDDTGDGYVVTSVSVELPGGVETLDVQAG